MTEQNNEHLVDQSELPIESELFEESVKKYGGFSLLLLFRKIKKKIANFNIRCDLMQKRIDEVVFDTEINHDEIDELDEKLELVKSELELMGASIQGWPSTTTKVTKTDVKEDIKADEEDAVAEKKEAEFWNSRDCCCWTCLHSNPTWNAKEITHLICSEKSSGFYGQRCHPLSKCFAFVQSSYRKMPPPNHLLTCGYYRDDYRPPYKYEKPEPEKIVIRGDDLNTGVMQCWE